MYSDYESLVHAHGWIEHLLIKMFAREIRERRASGGHARYRRVASRTYAAESVARKSAKGKMILLKRLVKKYPRMKLGETPFRTASFIRKQVKSVARQAAATRNFGSWQTALREWNDERKAQDPDAPWCVPKKGTPEHAAVRAKMAQMV